MACCLIAAFLFAQFMAMVRRWGMFWGLVPVPQGETADTLVDWMRRTLQRRAVRMAVTSALVFELVAASTWVYVQHGTHLTQLADVGWSYLHGRKVVYAEACGPGQATGMRLVWDRAGHLIAAQAI